ncbi:MAG TPA: Uma2 family endonuclease [Gemmatimonadaceae bacterium]|nr:Uma2 family endonuclease [Gemmatimonadaceae bacterium]
MGMAAPYTRWTVDRLRALPDDGRRYEIIEGDLFVTPSPSVRHQRASLALAVRLRAYLAVNRIGEVIIAPADVEFSDDTVVEPDVFVVPLIGGRPVEDLKDVGRPLLIAEILSPSTERTDRGRKRELFQARGVPEYWIVNVEARVFERWRPAATLAELVTERVEWRPAPGVEPFEMTLDEFWREVFEGPAAPTPGGR